MLWSVVDVDLLEEVTLHSQLNLVTDNRVVKEIGSRTVLKERRCLKKCAGLVSSKVVECADVENGDGCHV